MLDFSRVGNPLHKLKEFAVLYCLYHACLLKQHQPFGSGKRAAQGAGGILDMLRGPLWITVRCACKSTGGCHCFRCEHFLNSFYKPLQDFGPIALNWKALSFKCRSLPKFMCALRASRWGLSFWLGWLSLPFLPMCSGCFSHPITSLHLDQGAELAKDYKKYKVNRFLPI